MKRKQGDGYISNIDNATATRLRQSSEASFDVVICYFSTLAFPFVGVKNTEMQIVALH